MKMKNRHVWTNKDWIKFCIGLVVFALSIIILSGQTFIGQFFTYLFAYVFGVFHFVLVFFLICVSLLLIFRHNKPKTRKSATIVAGLIILGISLFSLSSLSILKENQELSFTTFSEFYSSRIKSFASSPFVIDSYSAIMTLGGGYLGLLFCTLLSSIWGYIGNCIFFALLLVLALFLLLYFPVARIIEDIIIKKNDKVKYTSPFRKKTDKVVEAEQPVNEEEQIEKTPEEVMEENLRRPLSNDEWTRTSTMSFPANTFSTLESQKPLSRTTTIVQPVKEEKKPEEPVETQWEDDRNAEPENTAREEFNKSFSSNTSSFGSSPFDDSGSKKDFSFISPLRSSERKEEPIYSKPQIETKPIAQREPVREEKDEEIYQDFSSKPIQETPRADEVKPAKPIIAPSYPQQNPLEKVAKDVKPKPTNEFTFSAPAEPEPEKEPLETPIDQKILDDEPEPNDIIAKRYFEGKQQALMENARKQEMEKNMRKAELLRHVSDVPKFYDYDLPTDKFLMEHDDSAKIDANRQAAEEKLVIINKVFKEFDYDAKAVSYTIGASVTRFNVEAGPGERSDKISSYLSELQTNLNGDLSVRVEPVVEGLTTSGIEVGNPKPMAVAFKDIFESIETNTKDNLLVPIGKDISGNIVTFPINQMPHLLVAGTTGSGKSVLIHSMIVTLVMRNYPSQMKLILIDPKQGAEFMRYDGCPHLLCPIIDDASKAVLALAKLCVEMDRRFVVLKGAHVSNIADYNKARVGREAVMEEMPYIVCIIDEFADLMQVGGKEIATYVQRIAQKARAIGIHMIIATQRPSKESVPMTIKANIACRIGLLCATNVDSRVILDDGGAESLLGKGDLLFRCPGRKSIIRAQSPFLADEEIDNVLKYLRKVGGEPIYSRDFLEIEDMVNEETQVKVDPEAKLYNDVKDFVIHTGITDRDCIMKNFKMSAPKLDSYLSAMVSENVLMQGYGGTYVLGPAAMSVLESENNKKGAL